MKTCKDCSRPIQFDNDALPQSEFDTCADCLWDQSMREDLEQDVLSFLSIHDPAEPAVEVLGAQFLNKLDGGTRRRVVIE